MLKIDKLVKSFDGKEVFNDISFILNDNEKVALIGRNGCGKSTLLKIINKDIEADSGSIVLSRNYTIGYLKQYINFTEKTILDEAMLSLPEHKKDNFWEVEQILQNVGFTMEDMKKSPDAFSGGWQIRLNLAKLLIGEPDLLLLDEPTNYLDIISVRWLKDFLKNWKGAVLVVSHDRQFLNDIITHTLIIHRGKSKKITGNIEDMYSQLAEEEDTYEKTRINEEKKRAKTQAFIDRFRYKATKAKQVQSKIKMLEKQDIKEKLSDIQNLEFDFTYKDIITNKPMVEVKDLTFGYDKDNILIKDFSFKVEKGDKICIIGRNGKGKTTLMKLINKELQPLSGSIDINNKVDIGYFGQMNIERLNLNNTIEQELWTIDEKMPRSNILNTAGVMMFTGDDYMKKINVLSGGEKSRVLLGKIILQPCNLLLLDEPTNHLDMESSIALINALNNFDGASITITHNEDFLNNLATKLIVFDNNKVFVFEGNYENFLKEVGWCEEEQDKKEKNDKKDKNNKIDIIKNNTKKNKQLKDKLENEIIDLEIEIENRVNNGNYDIVELQNLVEEKINKLNNL